MMARMLGLPVSVESNFELVTRLEKLILANQKNIISTLPVEQADITSTLLVDHGFAEVTSAAFRSRRADDPSLHHQHDDDDDDDDDVPDSSRSSQCHSSRTRSRSLSPMRTRDPNIY